MGSYKSLAEARVALQSKARVAKDQAANAGKYEYKYANIADLLEATRDVRAECGIEISDRIEPEVVAVARMVGITLAEVPTGDRWALRCTVRHVDSGESDHCVMPIPSSLWGRAQELGSYLTYHRRYGYLGLLGMAAEDDDGLAAQREAERRDQPSKPSKPAKGAKAPPTSADIIAGLDAATSLDIFGRWYKHAYASAKDSPTTAEPIGQAVQRAQVRIAKTLQPDGELRVALMSGDRDAIGAALGNAGIVGKGEVGCYLAWAAEMGDTVPPEWVARVKGAKTKAEIDAARKEMQSWTSPARKRVASALLTEADHRISS